MVNRVSKEILVIGTTVIKWVISMILLLQWLKMGLSRNVTLQKNNPIWQIELSKQRNNVHLTLIWY